MCARVGGGRTNALRALLKAEQERGSDFLRLANALSALYPKDSEEKRLLDAMLLAICGGDRKRYSSDCFLELSAYGQH